MKDRAVSVQNSSKRTQPFRSLIFLGIWKFLRGNSSAGLGPGKGELLELRTSVCPLLRRSGASCSGITPSSHPVCSPFWLVVAEVAVDDKFFMHSPPSERRSPVSVHSVSFFPSTLGFSAIFCPPMAVYVARWIQRRFTDTLSSSPELRHCEYDVYVLLLHCKTTAPSCNRA